MKKLLLLCIGLIAALSVSAQTPEVVVETFGNWFNPTSKPSSTSETTNTSSVTNITYTSSDTYYNASSSAIIMMGSTNQKGVMSFTLPYAISKLTLTSGKGTGVKAKVTVYANGTAIKTDLAIDAKSTDFSIDIPANYQAAGTVYKIAQTTANNTQFSSFSYTKADGNQTEQPVKIGDIEATYGTETITTGAEVTVEEGTEFTFKAENASKIEVVGEKSADAAELTWTPAVCADKLVKVIATRVGSTSKELSFTLTVTAKNPGPGPIEPGKDKITEKITPASFNVTEKGSSYGEYSFTSTETGITYSSVFMPAIEGTDIVFQYNFQTSEKSGKNSKGSGINSTANPQGYVLTKVTAEIQQDGKAIGLAVFAKEGNYTKLVKTVIPEKNAAEKQGVLGSGTGMVEEITLSAAKKFTGIAVHPENINAFKVLSYTFEWSKATEEKPEPAGEIALEHVRHFQLSEYELTDEVIHVMAGTELTFTSENADKMTLTAVDEAASSVLPKAVDGNTITWTTPDDALDMFKLTVTATRDNGSEPRVKTYTMKTEFITPAAPNWKEENGQIIIACESGALHIKMEAAKNPGEVVPAMMRAAVQDWTPATTDVHPRKVTFTKAELDNLKVYGKSVTPQSESKEMDPFWVLGDNVLGIENVAGDFADGEKRYYNLQGMRVAGDCPGIYIVREGSKVSKVVVR